MLPVLFVEQFFHRLIGSERRWCVCIRD